ncbi:hypothetical protein AVEN_219495-1 [Araneus ventricosus]|uniref:DUF4817 domain-containing protein n=1 Tax=Araneus ventricosus TaxID=182803 RepID=A0A4Y2BPL5_ARAVE|nr:hypothetical protein AVEN_219495-1 [Araneus ventricosus]
MSKYSVPERISIVKAYYSSNNSPIAAQRKFATEYKLKTTGPSVTTIKNVIEKFERTAVLKKEAPQGFLANHNWPYAKGLQTLQPDTNPNLMGGNIGFAFRSFA